MAKKHKHPEHVNHERWLVSYADFITLLFAFFTALYAISTVDAKKASKMAFSTRAAFNMDMFPTDQPLAGTSAANKQPMQLKMGLQKSIAQIDLPQKFEPTEGATKADKEKSQAIKEMLDDLNTYVEQKQLNDKIKVRMDRNNLVLTLAEAGFFGSGGADLRPESLPILNTVAEKILTSDMHIRIEGHTDNVPINTKEYRSNWELSTARAVSVMRYLAEEFDYDPKLLSVAGYASYRPISDNDTEEGRMRNRRIDLVIVGDAPK